MNLEKPYDLKEPARILDQLRRQTAVPVLRTLVLGPRSVPDIARELRVKNRQTVWARVNELAGSGLVSTRAEGKVTLVTLDRSALSATEQALLRLTGLDQRQLGAPTEDDWVHAPNLAEVVAGTLPLIWCIRNWKELSDRTIDNLSGNLGIARPEVAKRLRRLRDVGAISGDRTFSLNPGAIRPLLVVLHALADPGTIR